MTPARAASSPPHVPSRVDDRGGEDVAPVRADAVDRPARPEEYVRDRAAGEQAGARDADEVGGGQGGHHLAVLRVVHAAREGGGEVGFEVVQGVALDRYGGDPGGPLLLGEALQRGESVGCGGDDEAALRLVLGELPDLLGQLGPQSAGQEGEVEFGAGFLVGDEEVALRRRSCPRRPGRGPRRSRRGPPGPRRRRRPRPPFRLRRPRHRRSVACSRQYYVTCFSGWVCFDTHVTHQESPRTEDRNHHTRKRCPSWPRAERTVCTGESPTSCPP